MCVCVPYLSVTIIHLSHISNCLASVHFNYIVGELNRNYRSVSGSLFGCMKNIIALCSFQVAEAIITTAASIIIISRGELM